MEYRGFIKLVGLLLFFAVLFTAVHSSEKRIETTINDAFKYAIEQDYQNRKDYLRGLSRDVGARGAVRNYSILPTVERKIGSYSFRTSDGVTSYIFADSVPEEAAKRLLNQFLMEQLCKLNPNNLKKKLQEQLQTKDISASVGILCLRDTIRYWSEVDSIVPKNVYSTPRHTLDLTGTLKVQAWVDYEWVTVLKHIDPVTYVLLLLLIGVAMWVWASPQRVVKQEETDKEEILDMDVEKGIRISIEKKELWIDGEFCSIAPLDLALLQMLYEQKGGHVTREAIKQRFWPIDDNAGEKIDSHIKTIRRILKDYPQYQIVTVRGIGYYFTIV